MRGRQVLKTAVKAVRCQETSEVASSNSVRRRVAMPGGEEAGHVVAFAHIIAVSNCDGVEYPLQSCKALLRRAPSKQATRHQTSLLLLLLRDPRVAVSAEAELERQRESPENSP